YGLHRYLHSFPTRRSSDLTPQGDLLSAEEYNRTFTMHGIIMIFFMLIPSIPAILGNFLIPIMIGARDLALPRINLLSWYLYIARSEEHTSELQSRSDLVCR